MFYMLSLYLGQASLILPKFAPDNAAYTMSNLRYGVQALLPIALLVAVVVSVRPRFLTPLIMLVVTGQSAVMLATGSVM